MKAQDATGSPLDLSIDLGIPPHMIDVDDHADLLCRELVGDVERLAQRHDHRAIRSEHRMKRLDAQPYATLASIRLDGGDSISDHGASGVDVAVGWWAAH